MLSHKTQTTFFLISSFFSFVLFIHSVSSQKSVENFLQSGEFLRYQGKIGDIEGGYGFLKIQSAQKEKKGVKIRASMKGRTNTFFDKVHRVNNRFWSSFFLGSHQPFRYDLKVDQNGTKQRRKLFYDPHPRFAKLKLEVVTQEIQHRKNKGKYQVKYKVPLNTHSLVSAVYYLRGLPFQRGKSFTFQVFATGRLWMIHARLVQEEVIQTFLGRKKALQIELKARYYSHRNAPFRRVSIWLSADALRIPYRIQGTIPYIGKATGVLVAYKENSNAPLVEKKVGLKDFFKRF